MIGVHRYGTIAAVHITASGSLPMYGRLIVWIGVFALLLGPASLWTRSHVRIPRESRPLLTAEADAEASSWSPRRNRVRVELEQPPPPSIDDVAAESGGTHSNGEARPRRSGSGGGGPLRVRDRSVE